MDAGKFFLLKAEETRTGNPMNILGDQVLVKMGGNETAGQLTVMLGVTPPKAGPPLHRHGREDETLFVLEGEYLFEVDGKQFRGGPGTLAFLPRGTVHTFQNVTEHTAKLLILARPSGIEDFFAEIDTAMRGLSEPDAAVLLPIFQKFGLEFIGPPIGARKMAEGA